MLANSVTVIVVTCNSMEVLPSFFSRLQQALAGERCPVLICDNASGDGVEAFVKRRWPDASFLGSDENQGYGVALNRGIGEASTPFVALMNPDVAVQPGGFGRLVAFLKERPWAGGVSGPVAHRPAYPSRLEMESVFPSRLIPVHLGYETALTRLMFYSGIQTKFPRIPWAVPWTTVAADDEIAVSRLNGSFGVFRRDALIRAGLFDPEFFLFFEEDDIAMRLVACGYRLYVTDRAVVVHLSGRGSGLSSSVTRGELLLTSQYAFFRKHYGAWYAGAAFFAIWSLLSVVVLYQHCLGRPHKALTVALWRWHLRRLLHGVATASGSSPARRTGGVDSRSASGMEERG